MSKKTIVRFTKAWRSYFVGDVAGFDKDTAEALIGGGVATSYSSMDAAAAQAIKEPQGASQPKAGKDKQASKRGGSAKPDSVTPSGSSLLPEPSSTAATGTGSGSDADQDDTENSPAGAGSFSETTADENGGAGDTDPDDEKP
ncbi:hypothetical protein ABDX87_19970 [Pseudomonas abietaniphila]|uniref:hypothetical protein n=1 Tax=Pseudomonas abietaniphila TaxID=89065 RepID=UPI003216DEC3